MADLDQMWEESLSHVPLSLSQQHAFFNVIH